MGKNLFDKIFFTEADEDPPDVTPPSEGNDAPASTDDTGDTTAPVTDDVAGGNDDPPDLSPDGGDETTTDDGTDDGMGGVDFGDYGDDSQQPADDSSVDVVLDKKIENILKKNLYSNFLSLIDAINDIEGNFVSNNDMIYSKSPEASQLLSKISQLKTNLVSYTALYFMNKPYGQSALLYEKAKEYMRNIIEQFKNYTKTSSKDGEPK